MVAKFYDNRFDQIDGALGSWKMATPLAGRVRPRRAEPEPLADVREATAPVSPAASASPTLS
jgi:hypothetical protein